LSNLSRTLFSYQIFIEAESTPDVDFLVEDARVNSARHEAKRQQRVAASR
jgi:hypothetical protein